jgi:sulfite exporter TauE/SafE
VADNLSQALFGSSLTAYGVLWLIVGVILVVAGLLLLMPRGLATEVSRWVGIVGAAVAAITAATWLPYYPIWALVYIGLAVVIIYGLLTHFTQEAAAR